MSWWGKLIGGTVGLMLGGPLGALLGAVLGHQIDARRDRRESLPPPFEEQERIQTAFFTATFAVMGRLAKADGRVTTDEIRAASAVMEQLRLTPQQKQVARDLFRQGKQPEFPLEEVVEQLRREIRQRRTLLRMFLEIQLQAALVDGALHPEEHRLLSGVATRLGFSRMEFEGLRAMVEAELRLRGHARSPGEAPRQATLHDAYALLNISPNTEVEGIKRAYRRLMSQHHPDKLVAKGLPEEMVRLATQKTQEIKAAYEQIKEARGF